MGSKDHLCALAHQVFDGGERAHNALVGGDHTVFHRDVEVTADENFLPCLDLHILNRFLVVSHMLLPFIKEIFFRLIIYHTFPI